LQCESEETAEMEEYHKSLCTLEDVHRAKPIDEDEYEEEKKCD